MGKKMRTCMPRCGKISVEWSCRLFLCCEGINRILGDWPSLFRPGWCLLSTGLDKWWGLSADFIYTTMGLMFWGTLSDLVEHACKNHWAVTSGGCDSRDYWYSERVDREKNPCTCRSQEPYPQSPRWFCFRSCLWVLMRLRWHGFYLEVVCWGAWVRWFLRMNAWFMCLCCGLN